MVWRESFLVQWVDGAPLLDGPRGALHITRSRPNCRTWSSNAIEVSLSENLADEDGLFRARLESEPFEGRAQGEDAVSADDYRPDR